MKGVRILITGGAGFIGSNIAQELSVQNEVTVVDNLSTGRSSNIESLITSRRIHFVEGDVSNLNLMKKLCRKTDIVFHEAAIPSVARSVKNPLATNKANAVGTLTALVASKECGVGRFVFASSSSVYGDTAILPKREDMIPNPLSPYALTKVMGENYCRLFDSLYGLSTICLRYFNVYGPNQDPNSEYAAVIPRFISRSLAGERLPIFDDGKQTRDFTYVGDVVRANILAGESTATGVYNIASGKRISILELADTVGRLTRTKPSFDFHPVRPGDIRDSLADIRKAGADLGYSPSIGLEEGLARTVESIRREPHKTE